MTDPNFPEKPMTPQQETQQLAHSETFVSGSNIDSSPSPSPSSSSPSLFRSLSVDDDFFEGLDFGTNSMQGSSTTTSSHARRSTNPEMPPHHLAQLSRTDLKRAKRSLANRKAEARSKERKARYTAELESQLRTLRLESTSQSAQVAKLKRDTAVLTTENRQLTLRLQAMKQQEDLIVARDKLLRDEIMRLKIVAGEVQADNGINVLLHPQFASQHFPTYSFGTAQTQHEQQQQKQHHRPHPTSGNTDPQGQLQTQYAQQQQQQHHMPHPTSGNTNPCAQLLCHLTSGNTDPLGQRHTQYAQQQQQQHHRSHPTLGNTDPREQLHTQYVQQQLQHHMPHQISGNTDSCGQFRPNFSSF